MEIPTKAAVKADPNLLFASKPACPVAETPVEVSVVGKRCVYVNDYRIAGSKPYVSENLPSHDFKTTLRKVLDAFTRDQIRAALKEVEVERDYFKAYHAQEDAHA